MGKKNMYEVAVARESRRALRGRKPLTTERELGRLAFWENVFPSLDWPEERTNGWYEAFEGSEESPRTISAIERDLFPLLFSL